MAYVHIDVNTVQTSFHREEPCGDVVRTFRLPEMTYIVFADGCGHGVKAHITAIYIAERLITLLKEGCPIRAAFQMVIKTIQQSKGKDLPYAAVTAIKILNDGETTVLTYEMPQPIFSTGKSGEILTGRASTIDKAVILESYCFVEPGDSILIMSDGITDAGIGVTTARGWTIANVKSFVNSFLSAGNSADKLADAVHDQARLLWADAPGDDCTAVQCRCRTGNTVTILTGPPADPRKDRAVIDKFLRAPRKKIVCGATTAKLVAGRLEKEVEMDYEHSGLISPPKYLIEGIDLATEGAITLNQAYNILNADPIYYEEGSGVTGLCLALREADGVVFMVGKAQNTGHEHISFRQRGILPRDVIVSKMADKLRDMGKMVVVEEF